jgi:geranylgeranyl diphosphate synthase type II
MLHEVELMARQSAEGQAMELDWVATNAGRLTDQDYFVMCTKKTCWYSFITPMRSGLIAGWPAGSDGDLGDALERITRFGMILGIAFQVQDDLLNLRGEMDRYGKEIHGDLYEGKRTLMLNHVLRTSDAAPRILAILAMTREEKTAEHIAFVYEEMQRCGSIEHGWNIARTYADRAGAMLGSLEFIVPRTPLAPDEDWGCEFADARFLRELVNFVVYRNV